MVKKSIVLFLSFIFLISFASAFEFDNVLRYEENDMKVTIENAFGLPLFGSDLGTAELKSHKSVNHILKVAPSDEGVVMYYDLNFNEIYKDGLGEVEFVNMSDGEYIEKDYHFVIWDTITEEKNNYSTECNDVYNETDNSMSQVCQQVFIGTYIEEKQDWVKLNISDIPKGQVRIGLATNVNLGDHIDGIWTIAGKKIKKHSEWTADLNVNIISYYKTDESSGNALDNIENVNLTNTGTATYGAGLINNAVDTSNTKYLWTSSQTSMGTGDFTYSFWMNVASHDSSNPSLFHTTNSWGDVATIAWSVYLDGSGVIQLTGVGGSGVSPTGAGWKHYVVSRNSTGIYLYIDSLEKIGAPTSKTFSSTYLSVGRPPSDQTTRAHSTKFDEIGIWNRALSIAEITQLYNGGSGISWIGQFGNVPAVTLTSPEDFANLTSGDIDFIATITDDEQVDNVTLFIDGVLNETNSSGFNGTYTFSKSVSEGVHNWSILAFDNASLSNQSETREFNFTQPPIFIDLLSPADSSTHNIPLVNMSCRAYIDEGVTQLNLTINGVVNISITNSSIAQNLTISQEINFSEDNYTWGCSAINPSTSAISSNRTFEVLYSSPIINLLTPVNETTVLTEDVAFTFNATDINGLDNVTLFIDGVLNETNSSGLEGNYSFVRTLSDGFYNWSVTATSILGKTTNSTTRTFLVHTLAPSIDISAPSGTIALVHEEGENVTLVYNISEGSENATEHFDECWYIYNTTFISTGNFSLNTHWNVENGTMSASASNNTAITNLELPSSNIVLQANLADNALRVSNFVNYIPNCLNQSYAIKTLISQDKEGYYSCMNNSDNEQFIIKLTDFVGTQSVFESYNFGGDSLNCTGNTANFSYADSQNNLTVFAKDEFGFVASNTTTWSYVFEKFNLTYETPVYEGSLNTFSVGVIIGGGETITQAIFNYNDTNYTTNIIFSGGEYLITSSVTAPVVSTDTNLSFGFYIVVNGQTYKPRTDQQEVLNIDFGACGVGDDLLLNISLLDEGLRTPILGNIELNAQLIGKITEEITESTNVTFENVSYGAICLTPTVAKEDFFLDTEIRYESTDHSAELYNIQKANLSEYPKNLTLFDLALNDSTEFLITYQGDSLIRIEGAVIQLQRKYVGLDAFEVVEAPLTSNLGTAVVHIDLNTELYSVTVVKDGVVLDIFTSVVFNCENELSGQCTHLLLGRINPQNSITLENLRDFTYSVSEAGNTITTLFSIPSGTPSSVNIVLTQTDTFGNTSLCNQTIISSAGSIDCSYDDTFGDSVISLEIKRDGTQQAIQSYVVPEAGGVDFLENNYFIVVILLLSLVGMAFSSPEWIIMNVVVVLLLAGSIWLLNGLNFVMGLGSLIWLVLGAGILIMKISKQEDR